MLVKQGILRGARLAFACAFLSVSSQVLAADRDPSDDSRTFAPTSAYSGIDGDAKVYSLAVVTGPDTPAVGDRTYSVNVSPATGPEGRPMGRNRLTGFDDRLNTANGIGTQIDGLAHIGIDGIHHGGVAQDDIYAPGGVRQFGVESIPPIVGRGILLDIAALKGVQVLDKSYEITRQDVKAALHRQGVSIRPGDVALIHTGWLASAGEDASKFLASSPGLGKEAAEYLAALGVSAVGADTWGVEVVPAANSDEFFPVHQILIATHGIYLLENIWLQDLARDEVRDFLFVLGVPRLAGSVQSIIHPLAIR